MDSWMDIDGKMWPIFRCKNINDIDVTVLNFGYNLCVLLEQKIEWVA